MGADGYIRAISTIRLDLLEIFGRGYVVDHCVAFFKKEKDETLYRCYVADLLKVTAEMAGRAAGYEVTAQSYRELIGLVKEDDRTGDEIAADIIKRAGLRMKE